jgi:Secretion system C-terminal sorting domain
MRTNILLIAVLFTLTNSFAQKNQKVFAITNDNSLGSGYLWMNISEIDPATGQVLRPLFDRSKTSYALYDGISKVKTYSDQVEINGQKVSSNQFPTATMVAAAAYDNRHNRLFITPMQIPELRWVDMDDNNTTLKVYCVKFPSLSGQDLAESANHITRMVINADGYGYALTNDANHLFRFTTGKKLTITDLGPINDAGENQTVSIHNKCSSFGGDMIADKAGNLYVISAYHAVFKVDVPDRSAVYLGNIKGLPGNYTTNGAAINAAGELIVSSANSTEGYFKVDMTSWESQKITGNNAVAASSDLASPYFAFDKKPEAEATTTPAANLSIRQKISVYPNPVTEGLFRLSFDNKETGRYTVHLMDLAGRIVLQRAITVANEKQLIEIEVPAKLSRGMYMVKVLNANGKKVYGDKLLVE